MRLHRLEVSAFGPFGGTVSLDFDALGEAGLFLLTGNTGAGKTSLLDAVCFALYGQVPGDRQLAGRFRSDHAPVGAPPRVDLELTVGDRRFRFVRSPAWERPKARGTGTTLQSAAAAVSELRKDDWEPLATRIPDVSQLAAAVLGMDVHQFKQVVLLPQGHFQDFLRADVDARKVVLERLFATSRFRDVERWLVVQRQQSGRLNDQRREAVRRLVDQIAAVAGVDDPGDSDDSLTAWAALICGDLQQLARTVRTEANEAQTHLALRQRELTTAEKNLQLRERGEAAQTAQAQQRSCQAAVDSCREELRRAENARDVVALLPPMVHAEKMRSVAARAAALARAAADGAGVAPIGGSDLRDQLDALDAARRRSEYRAATLLSLDQMTSTRTKLATEIAEVAVASAAVRAEHEAATAELAGLPRQVEKLTATVSQARTSVGRAEVLGAQLPLAQDIFDAARNLDDAIGRLNVAHRRRGELVASHNDSRDKLNDLRALRLAGAAASLAAQLETGSPCLVCGGTEHPSPAVGEGTVPTAADELTAHDAMTVAEAARAEAEAHFAHFRERVLALEARARGTDAETAASVLDSLRSDLGAARAAAALAGPLAESLHGLESRMADVRQRLSQLDIRAAALGERLVLRTAQHEELDQKIRAQLGPDVDLVIDLARTEQMLQAIDSLSCALQDLSAAQQMAQTTLEAALAATVAAGFTTIDEVRAEAVTDARRAQLRAQVDDHDSAVRSTQATLADPSVQAAMRSQPPDVLGGRLALQAAEAAQQHTLEVAGQLSSRTEQADSLRSELAKAMAVWAPARHAHHVATAMAALAEGKAADNRLKVSLSAYVLSARLAAVIDAANLQLTPMTSGRYAFEHSSDPMAGDRSRGGGGLGLRILDSWTGQSRDPKTLSGGEMFQASLALALGLADVVSSEAGGAVMNSLFVDEGFGSLDSDSLDEVMDVLDGLRSGGRVVGVVSHVDALRERIPVQVRVVKDPSGSTVLQP